MSTKRSAIIIGAGPRLSLALAKRFGQGLGEVTLISRDGDRLSTLIKELKGIGIGAYGFVADAADLDAVATATRDAIAAMAPLKALIYNAAAVQPNRPLQLEPVNFAG